MTTQKIAIQPLNVPMGEFRSGNGTVQVFSTVEYRRALDQMAKAVNALVMANEALTARVAALGG